MGNPVIGCEHNWLAHYSPIKNGLPNMFLCTKCGLKVDPDEYGDIPGELEIARRELEEATGRKWLITASGNLVSPPTDHPGLTPLPGSKLMIDEIDQGMSFLLNGSPGKYPKVDDGTRRFPEGGIVSAPERILCEYEYKVLMVLAGYTVPGVINGAAFTEAFASLRGHGFILKTTGALTPKGLKCVKDLRSRGYPENWVTPTGRLTASRPEFAMPYGTKRQNMGKTETLAAVDYSKVEERVIGYMAEGLKPSEMPIMITRGEEFIAESDPRLESTRAITPLLLFSVMTLAAILAVAAYWPTVERWLGSAFAEALIKFSPFG